MNLGKKYYSETEMSSNFLQLTYYYCKVKMMDLTIFYTTLLNSLPK